MEKTCETCRHWLANYALLPHEVEKDGEVGRCEHQDLMAQPMSPTELEPRLTFLAAHRTFGCNQWEASDGSEGSD